MNETRVCCGPEKMRERVREKQKKKKKKKERGVQCGTAVVTMANAAWCDVSLAAELS